MNSKHLSNTPRDIRRNQKTANFTKNANHRRPAGGADKICILLTTANRTTMQRITTLTVNTTITGKSTMTMALRILSLRGPRKATTQIDPRPLRKEGQAKFNTTKNNQIRDNHTTLQKATITNTLPAIHRAKAIIRAEAVAEVRGPKGPKNTKQKKNLSQSLSNPIDRSEKRTKTS